MTKTRKKLHVFILEDEIEGYRHPIVDILKEAGHHLTVATSFPDAKKKFEGPYDLLLLDHDMMGYYEHDPNHPNTGYQFVKWLVRKEPVPKPEILLHSQNKVGRDNQRSLLEQHGYVVNECAYGPNLLKLLREQMGV
jgi:CheY-like chemotaxis protein